MWHMFNTTKICPACHQKKVQASDKLTPSGSFVWEICRVIILFVPTIIIVNWSKFLTLAHNTQTGFFLGFLLRLYLSLAYKNAVYLRQ